jgi:hypothetical protein
MKTVRITLCIILLISIVATTDAQTSDAEAEAIVNLLGVQKREAINQMVFIPKKDSAAFWKIYDEYQAQNKKTARDRIQLYERTAIAYQHMTPGAADSLATKYFDNRIGQEKMLQDYYKKVKSATNPVVAFQFYQAEVYLLTQIRAQIMSQIPAYGVLVKKH